MRWAYLLVLLATLGAMSGCTPVIGDSCGTTTDCSINGERVCDLARPGGSCTIFNCEADTCPDEAVCVRFRPEPSRLSLTACMRRCDDDGGCRVDDGYRCRTASQLDNGMLVEVVDLARANPAFCVSTIPSAVPAAQ